MTAVTFDAMGSAFEAFPLGMFGGQTSHTHTIGSGAHSQGVAICWAAFDHLASGDYGLAKRSVQIGTINMQSAGWFQGIGTALECFYLFNPPSGLQTVTGSFEGVTLGFLPTMAINTFTYTGAIDIGPVSWNSAYGLLGIDSGGVTESVSVVSATNGMASCCFATNSTTQSGFTDTGSTATQRWLYTTQTPATVVGDAPGAASLTFSGTRHNDAEYVGGAISMYPTMTADGQEVTLGQSIGPSNTLYIPGALLIQDHTYVASVPAESRKAKVEW